MQGVIVTFDVSKGNCHYQGFKDQDTSYSKPRVLIFKKSSFKELEDYASRLRETYDADEISYVFESTGVYHQVLRKYLDDHKLPYYIISPLISAKYRQTELHSNKTDPLDCKNIAKVYYGSDKEHLNPYKSPESKHEQLQKLNRYYEDAIEHLRKYKVTLRAYLDIALPDFDSCFPNRNIYNPLAMEVLKKWPHPDLILKAKESTMISYLEKKTGHNKGFIIRHVGIIKKWADEVYSGCDTDDEIVLKLVLLAKHIEEIRKEADDVLESLVNEARKEMLFDQLFSIPGIGENLAARIVAEIGDVERFGSINKLTSYAGVDPMIRQSGKYDGNHLSISKKGNKRLRCLLYLAISCNIRLKKNDPIYNFYQRKRQQPVPLKPKVARIAACRKLLAIIYGMSKSGELYRYD